MRILVLSLALVSSNFMKVCESSDETEPAASASISAEGQTGASAGAQAAASSEWGGSVVPVGSYFVELMAHERGLVEATVRTDKGRALAGTDGVALAVKGHAKGGARPDIKLAWDGPSARFRGDAGAGVELVPQPMDISLTVGGKAETGKLEHYALVAPPRFGGQVVVAGDYGAEVLADTNGEVQAFVATAAGAEVDGNAGLEVEAKLPTVDAKAHLVPLRFEGPRAAFVGKAQAGVAIAPGPLELKIKANGASHVGGLAKLVLRANAAHGGRIVVAGDYSMEVAVQPGNIVAAYVVDASGKAHAKGDLDLDLQLAGNVNQKVKLVWHAPSASYRAQLAAAVDLSAVPIEVTLKAGGRAFVGAAAALDARAKALAAADLDARAKANANLNVKGPSVKTAAHLDAKQAAAANATLKVTPPKIDISVNKSASASAGAGAKTSSKASTGGKASTGFSFGTK